MSVKKPIRSNTGLKSIRDLLLNFEMTDKPKYVSREFQDYGYRLAMELEDSKRISMYIKLAKEIDRAVIEQARSFVKDSQIVKSKSRLFLWKLTQLRKIVVKHYESRS